MSTSSWTSFFSHVLDSEAYKKAKYLPAGCWMNINEIDKLEGETAAYIYGNECSEAYLLQGYYKNLDKVWLSQIFLVPSRSAALTTTDYRADWSDEHSLYIVKERSKKSTIDGFSESAFSHFNWSYGVEQDTSVSDEDDETLVTYSVPYDDLPDANEEQLEVSSIPVESLLEIQEQVLEVSLVPVYGPTETHEQQPEVDPVLTEARFWCAIYKARDYEANPAGIAHDNRYIEPAGDYRALSFDCQPQYFISTTSPATSLWAVASRNALHWQHGYSERYNQILDCSPFSRKSVLASQACKTLTAVRYEGPGHTLDQNTGTALQNAVTGYANKSFLPVGSIMNEEIDCEDPHEFHTPSHPHWSSLTVPTSYTTPAYICYDADYDHKPIPLPYGRSKRKAVWHYSKLRNMQLCYVEPEIKAEPEEIVANEHEEREEQAGDAFCATDEEIPAPNTDTDATLNLEPELENEHHPISPPESISPPQSEQSEHSSEESEDTLDTEQHTPTLTTMIFNNTPLGEEENAMMIEQIKQLNQQLEDLDSVDVVDAMVDLSVEDMDVGKEEAVARSRSGSVDDDDTPAPAPAPAPDPNSEPEPDPIFDAGQQEKKTCENAESGMQRGFEADWTAIGWFATGAVAGAGLLAVWQKLRR